MVIAMVMQCNHSNNNKYNNNNYHNEQVANISAAFEIMTYLVAS